jgi:hypothetical protein
VLPEAEGAFLVWALVKFFLIVCAWQGETPMAIFTGSAARIIRGSASPRTGERPNGRRVWSPTACSVLAMTVGIYFGELVSAIALAITLLAASTLKFSIAAPLFCCGLAGWTLAEYIGNRFVLHAIAPLQHGMHHARPQDAIDKIFWQIWLAFALTYLTVGGTLLAGVLVASGWFLSIHYCAHHNPAILPASLLKHHLDDHHGFVNRNYGVTTKFWNRLFGTLLRRGEASSFGARRPTCANHCVCVRPDTFGDKGRSWEQGSVAIDRHEPGEI